MSNEDQKIIEQISYILVREKQISSEEQLRMLRLLKEERRIHGETSCRNL